MPLTRFQPTAGHQVLLRQTMPVWWRAQRVGAWAAQAAALAGAAVVAWPPTTGQGADTAPWIGWLPALGLAWLAALHARWAAALPDARAVRAMPVGQTLSLATLAALGWASGATSGPGHAGWPLPLMGVTVAFVAIMLRPAVTAVVLVASLLLALGAGLVAPRGPGPWLLGLALVGCAAAGRRTGLQRLGVLQTQREQAQGLQRLLALAADAHWEADAALRLLRVGQRDALGNFRPLALQREAIVWPEGARGRRRLVRAMLSRQTLSEWPLRWRDAEGRERHLRISGVARLDAQGRLQGYRGVARDVTEAHDERTQRLASQMRYQQLFHLAPAALLLHDRGRVLEANTAAARLLGYADGGALVGHDLYAEHLDGQARQAALQRLEQLLSVTPGVPLPQAESQLRRRDGRPAQVLVSSVRLGGEAGGQAAGLDAGRDAGGEAAGAAGGVAGGAAGGAGGPKVLSMFVDESAHHDALQALRRSESLLKTVVTLTPDIITLTDMQSGTYLMVNEAWAREVGHTVEAMLGRSPPSMGLTFEPAGVRERLLEGARRPGGVRDVPVTLGLPDGRRLNLRTSAVMVEYEGRECLLSTSRDVTETQRIALERDAIVDHVNVGIAVLRQRRFVMINAHLEQMLGRPVGSLLGQLGEVIWDDPVAQINAQVLASMRRGEMGRAEAHARHADGRRLLLRLSGKLLDPATTDVDSGSLWLIEDVTAEREAQAELARARDEAQASSRAKSAFLASTSHEIRTPLNALVGLAHLARQPQTEEGQRRLYLDQIAESADLLAALISDILDLSKIEAGKLEIVRADFDLRALLRALAHGHEAMAAERGLRFSIHTEGMPTWVHGDALRVRQLLVNLLHNAFKFTPSGSVGLTVSVRAPGLLRFEVSDTGPGLPASVQARLFEPFTQGDQSATREHRGTGLGLSICRQLTQLMDGSIQVQSLRGMGTRFRIDLPLPTAEPADQHPTQEAEGDEALRGLRVLMVEDNPVNMMIGVAMLQQWGVDVVQAFDGPQALAAVLQAEHAQRPFDLVLMDVQMPGMSGYQVTEALRARRRDHLPPVVALTAAALVSEREHALASGMDDFLTKPVDLQRLRALLLRVAGGGRRL